MRDEDRLKRVALHTLFDALLGDRVAKARVKIQPREARCFGDALGPQGSIEKLRAQFQHLRRDQHVPMRGLG